MTEAEAAVANARRRLNLVLNEMKLLANNIEVDPKPFMVPSKIVNILRKTVGVLESFDDILAHAQADEGGENVQNYSDGVRAAVNRA